MNENPIQPFTSNQRRVVGVLVEKSKTTPDVYPMTMNSIRNACNQKSNRAPLMDLSEERIEDTLYQLRELGAAIEVHSSGRVPKFKHDLYDWLAVEKAELAVMAELLLRGQQTLGELRARSSRMESSLVGIGDLVPVVNQLITKGLIVELTPKGRGQMVTHNLYETHELDRLKAEFPSLAYQEIQTRGSVESISTVGVSNVESEKASPPPIAPAELNQLAQSSADSQSSLGDGERIDELSESVDELKQQVAMLLNEVEELKAKM